MRSFIAKSYSPKINNSEHTMTPVSIAFRWAMLCTKSKLRFRQYSFNHRTRNLRSVEILRLTPYPLYQHAIVPFEFPRQVGWLFPLFTFNNVPLRGRYTFALSSARFSAYYPHMLLLAVFVIDCIVNFGGPLVECVLQQMIAVDTFCAVSVRDADIAINSLSALPTCDCPL